MLRKVPRVDEGKLRKVVRKSPMKYKRKIANERVRKKNNSGNGVEVRRPSRPSANSTETVWNNCQRAELADFQTISDRLLSPRTAIRKGFGIRFYSPVVITNYSVTLVRKTKKKRGNHFGKSIDDKKEDLRKNRFKDYTIVLCRYAKQKVS